MDGVQQPYEFRLGYTYPNKLKQYTYDISSIAGQYVGTLRELLRGNKY